jgi:hypothetical protein
MVLPFWWPPDVVIFTLDHHDEVACFLHAVGARNTPPRRRLPANRISSLD